MSMQITIDPTEMTKDQREFIAGFILGYPSPNNKWLRDNCSAAIMEKLLDPTPIPHNEEISPEAAFGGKSIPLAPAPMQVGDQITGAITGKVVSVGSVDLDKDGLPWDARIHSSNKAKVADGSWRKKRGLDPAILVTVEAELKQIMGVPYSATQPNHVSIQENGDSPETVFKVAPPPPPPPAEITSKPVDERQQFVALVGRTTAAISQKKVTQEEVVACCAQFGIPSLPLLINRPDLIAQVAASIDALIASRK